MILKPERKLWTPPRNRVMPRSWYRQRGFFTPMPFFKRFEVDAADFDGTNDYMTRGAGLTGAVDSKSGILSYWIRIDALYDETRFIFRIEELPGLPSRFSTILNGVDDTLRVTGLNSSGSLILGLITASSYGPSANWLHVLASWDLSVPVSHLYVNDTDDQAAPQALVNDTIDYTSDEAVVGARSDGFNAIDMGLAELCFFPGQYLDFSVVSNRRKFISASGKPVHLGTTGALPTGTAPLVYLHLDDGEAVANFAVNAGSDGATFTITGTLDTGSTSPSD